MLDMDSVYREYVTVVYKFLLSLCYEEDMAEELTQETFYQAVRSANRYDGSCKVSTWLCQIAKHLWYQEVAPKEKRYKPADRRHPFKGHAGGGSFQYKGRENGIIQESTCFGRNCKRSGTSAGYRSIFV